MRCLIFIISLLTTLPTHAAIEGFSESAALAKLFIETPDYEARLTSERTGRDLKYRPNVAGVTGISLYFNGLFGLTYGFRSAITDEDVRKKGTSVYDDFRFALAYEEFRLDLNFQSYKGFFIEDTASLDPTYSSGDPYYQDPDMTLENLSLNLSYVMSPESFSLTATTDQTLRQTESGGSILLGFNISNLKISSPTGLIPAAVSAEFDQDSTLEEISALSLSANFGYGYSFIFNRNWYLTGTGRIGPGLQIGTTKTATESNVQQSFMLKTDLLLGLGYNGDRFIAGANAIYDISQYQAEATDIQSTLMKVNIFIGARF